MRLSVTRWRPNTCDCIIHYQWDVDVPVEDRIHTAVSQGDDGVPSKACVLHSGYDTIHDHFEAVLAHNRANNAKAD